MKGFIAWTMVLVVVLLGPGAAAAKNPVAPTPITLPFLHVAAEAGGSAIATNLPADDLGLASFSPPLRGPVCSSPRKYRSLDYLLRRVLAGTVKVRTFCIQV